MDELISTGVRVDMSACLLTRVPIKLYDSKFLRQTISSLDLSNNCIRHVPEQFWTCVQLRQLDLHGNKLTTFHVDETGVLEVKCMRTRERIG